MIFRLEPRCLVVGLALVILVPGCRKTPAVSNNSSPPPPSSVNPVSLRGPEGAGAGVSGVLPAVGRTVALSDMSNLAKFYLDYNLSNGMPPADLKALGIEQTAPKMHKAIADGDVVVFWGVDGQKTAAGASNTVLAYPKEMAAKSAAVPVAFYDGTARNLTKVEFEKAAKGGK